MIVLVKQLKQVKTNHRLYYDYDFESLRDVQTNKHYMNYVSIYESANLQLGEILWNIRMVETLSWCIADGRMV